MYEDTGVKVQKEKKYDVFSEIEKQYHSRSANKCENKREVNKDNRSENSAKLLGVCISPSLNCRDEFEYVKQKMKVSIKKLIEAAIELNRVFLYFIINILKNVFLDVKQ